MPRSAKICEFTARARNELAQLANDNAPPSNAAALRELMRNVLDPDFAPISVARIAGDRLDDRELGAIRTLIDWQAGRFGVFSRLITLAVEIMFEVDDLVELCGPQFDPAVAFLVNLPGSDDLTPAAELFEGGRA